MVGWVKLSGLLGRRLTTVKGLLSPGMRWYSILPENHAKTVEFGLSKEGDVVVAAIR